MRIAIIGIGAMGCLFAAKLSRVAQVTLIGHWPKQLAMLRKHGLRFIELNGRSQTIHLTVTDTPQTADSADLGLILVKSYQTPQAAVTAQQLLLPQGLALTLQNGLGNLEQLTAVLGKQRAHLGTTSEGATLPQPGVVQHAGQGHTYIADSEETADSPREIVDLFQEAGFQTSLASDTAGLVWGKLAVNAGINPLTAILQVPNGYLVENAAARQLMAQAAHEVAQVAAAQKINLPFNDAAAQAIAVAQATAANHSSMRQDLQNGRPTEIAAICGAVVEAGRRFGVPTPLNYVLQTAVQQAEQGVWPEASTPEAILQLLMDKVS